MFWTVRKQMVMGDLPAIGALTHMSRVTQSVYAALLRVHVEEQGWGDVVTNQVRAVRFFSSEAYNALVLFADSKR